LLVMLLLYWNHMHHQLQKNQYYLEVYLHENTWKSTSDQVGGAQIILHTLKLKAFEVGIEPLN
jgi:hypothetical protein